MENKEWIENLNEIKQINMEEKGPQFDFYQEQPDEIDQSGSLAGSMALAKKLIKTPKVPKMKLAEEELLQKYEKE